MSDKALWEEGAREAALPCVPRLGGSLQVLTPHFLTTLTPLGEESKGQITRLLSTKAGHRLKLNHIIKPYKKPEEGSDT